MSCKLTLRPIPNNKFANRLTFEQTIQEKKQLSPGNNLRRQGWRFGQLIRSKVNVRENHIMSCFVLRDLSPITKKELACKSTKIDLIIAADVRSADGIYRHRLLRQRDSKLQYKDRHKHYVTEHLSQWTSSNARCWFSVGSKSWENR